MPSARAGQLLVQRNVILGLLLTLATAAWALLVWQSESTNMDMAAGSPTMGMRAPLFLMIWVVMMVAMMFPTAAPMILTFHAVQARRRQQGGPYVATWIFVATYMLVWTLSGVVAYAGALGAEAVAARSGISAAADARIGGAVLVAAGVYQLTPFKNMCLSKCRTPISFIMTSWSDGTTGALRMGLLHGTYCLGCCWLLFVMLFPLGIMNIAAMAVVTLVIFAEKTLPWTRLTSRATAAVLVAYGALVLVVPSVLPTSMAGGSMTVDTPAAPSDMPRMPMPETAPVPAR